MMLLMAILKLGNTNVGIDVKDEYEFAQLLTKQLFHPPVFVGLNDLWTPQMFSLITP